MGRPKGSKNISKKTHCIQGHEQEDNSRYSGGQCKVCVKERAKAYAKANPEKVRDNWHRWLAGNLNKENSRQRAKNLKQWGWTPEHFDTVLIEQLGLCALCSEPFTDTNMPCADHEHVSPPRPRGLLHRRCNSALGMLKDSPELCEAAAMYLWKWKA
jgi:hypothetical protein